MSPLTTQLAGLRGLLLDLESKSQTAAPHGDRSVLAGEIERLRADIVDLEAILSTARRLTELPPRP